MNTYDAIIVGAGFSGICAAKKLVNAGYRVKILEARDRIGGRVYTRHLDDDTYLELGGQWIGPSQDRMYALVDEHDIGYYETYNQGKNVIDLQGKVRTYTGLIPKMGVPSLLNLEYLMRRLERMARSIDTRAPYTHPRADIYDSMSLKDFVDKNSLTSGCKSVMHVGLETIFADNLSNLSLLHALFYIKSGTSLDSLLSIKDGAQQHRIKGGMQPLAQKIVDTLPDDTITLSSPVSEINDHGDHVSVIAKSTEYHAKYAIVATPPHLMGQINYPSGISEARQALMESLPMGKVAKCYAVYDKPFWRESGYSGQVVADEGASPMQATFDASPHDGSRGILQGFCQGDRYDVLMQKPEEERRKIVLDTFAKYYGDQARTPLYYLDYTMEDSEWTGGCYAALFGKGIWTSYKDLLAKPEGNIHFAGTETSTKWMGYIEGAVLAGERAADEIISTIQTA